MVFVKFLTSKVELGKQATVGYLACMAMMLVAWDGLQPPSAAVFVIVLCFVKAGCDEVTYGFGYTQAKIGKRFPIVTRSRIHRNRKLLLVLAVVLLFVMLLEYYRDSNDIRTELTWFVTNIKDVVRHGPAWQQAGKGADPRGGLKVADPKEF